MHLLWVILWLNNFQKQAGTLSGTARVSIANPSARKTVSGCWNGKPTGSTNIERTVPSKRRQAPETCFSSESKLFYGQWLTHSLIRTCHTGPLDLAVLCMFVIAILIALLLSLARIDGECDIG
jgi:hypothetical protein